MGVLRICQLDHLQGAQNARVAVAFLFRDAGFDSIGDVVRDIEMVYYRESGDEADAPPRILLEKIERGHLGVKSGIGFYRYPDPAFQRPGWLQNEMGS